MPEENEAEAVQSEETTDAPEAVEGGNEVELGRAEKRHADKQAYLAELMEKNRDLDRQITAEQKAIRERQEAARQEAQHHQERPRNPEVTPEQQQQADSLGIDVDSFLDGLSADSKEKRQSALNDFLSKAVDAKLSSIVNKIDERANAVIQENLARAESAKRYDKVAQELSEKDPNLIPVANQILNDMQNQGFNPPPEMVGLMAQYGNVMNVAQLCELGMTSLQANRQQSEEKQNQAGHPMAIGSGARPQAPRASALTSALPQGNARSYTNVFGRKN